MHMAAPCPERRDRRDKPGDDVWWVYFIRSR
jgi:hypothetical protein